LTLPPIWVLNLGTHRFPQLVRENEGRLVLAIEIPAQLQGAMALNAVTKIAIASR
jgi:hypothetical protein